MNHKEEHIIPEEEIKTIEYDVNGKLEEMDKLRDFFGSGHGVNIVNLISSWITREIVPHEKRLGVKFDYSSKPYLEAKQYLPSEV